MSTNLGEPHLSERARKRAAEMATDADLRVTPPREKEKGAAAVVTTPAPARWDDRLPPPGTVLTRAYKGGEVRVMVLADGFEVAGTVYPSLSAAAKAVTGSHVNGFAFFKLAGGAA